VTSTATSTSTSTSTPTSTSVPTCRRSRKVALRLFW
jgi:hypothetical protein